MEPGGGGGGRRSRKPGVVKSKLGVKGCCPLRTFVGSKKHLHWIKIDLNVTEIIIAQDYKHLKKIISMEIHIYNVKARSQVGNI